MNTAFLTKPVRLVQLNWPILFRGALYFLIPYLAIMAEKFGPFAEQDSWPSSVRLFWWNLLAIGSGLVALRAFYDGSAERHSQELKSNPPMNPPTPSGQ